MICPQPELGSSTKNKAPARRRDLLPAAPARSELPDPIRRPGLFGGRQGRPSMTITRDLCGALGAASQLIRDDYLPRVGDEVDEDDADPTPAARRQRRHRERRRHGVFVARVLVTGERSRR